VVGGCDAQALYGSVFQYTHTNRKGNSWIVWMCKQADRCLLGLSSLSRSHHIVKAQVMSGVPDGWLRGARPILQACVPVHPDKDKGEQLEDLYMEARDA